MTVAAVRRGYVVVVQDTRGQFKSEGRFVPYAQEITDGEETIAWVAALPYVDGQVGMFGLSYPGAVQWMTAPGAPASLKAIAPAMTFAHPNHFFYHGGIFEADFIEWLLPRQTRERLALKLPYASSQEASDAWSKNGDAWMDHRPLSTLPLMKGFDYWESWTSKPIEHSYWAPYDIEAQHGRVRVPALNLSGWNDDPYGQPGAIRNFVGMQARGGSEDARRGQRLVMGPWTHGVPSLTRTTYAGVDYGPNATFDYVDDRELGDSGSRLEAAVMLDWYIDPLYNGKWVKNPLWIQRQFRFWLRTGFEIQKNDLPGVQEVDHRKLFAFLNFQANPDQDADFLGIPSLPITSPQIVQLGAVLARNEITGEEDWNWVIGWAPRLAPGVGP